MHTSYHQAVAATGRLSSTDPNLQNIPIRTPEGRRIRQAFVAPPGHVLIAADYSQIELRIMAHLSGDAGLLEGVRARTATFTRRRPPKCSASRSSAVTSDQRRAAKAINFGLIYGMSAFGLARQLGIERGAAQQYVDLYFHRYPGVKRYMDETRAMAREQGYVETVFGRRLYLPEIRSRNAQMRQYAERSAINAPMQGTAADIIKRAMIDVHRWLLRASRGARLVMQVHDELVLEVPEARVDGVRAGLREHMTARGEPARAAEGGVGVGANWDERTERSGSQTRSFPVGTTTRVEPRAALPGYPGVFPALDTPAKAGCIGNKLTFVAALAVSAAPEGSGFYAGRHRRQRPLFRCASTAMISHLFAVTTHACVEATWTAATRAITDST